MSRSKNSGEVQAVRQDDIIACSCEYHDFRIGGIRLADTGPVNRFVARVQEERNPAARDSCPPKASCARESNFALFGKPRGIPQRLKNVFTLQIRIVRQQLLDGMARNERSHWEYRRLWVN